MLIMRMIWTAIVYVWIEQGVTVKDTESQEAGQRTRKFTCIEISD